MCSNKNEGFFARITREFGKGCKMLFKKWISHNYKLSTAKQQRIFLIKCRSHDVLPVHIIYKKWSITLRDYRLNRRLSNIKNDFHWKLLNLEIKDIHSQINFVKKRMVKIEDKLRSRIPKEIMANFIDSNYRRMRTHEWNIKTKLIKKFNRLISEQNSDLESFSSMDRSKWIVNKSSMAIPDDILNFLSLGGSFGLPVNIKDGNDRKNTILDVIKNVEASIHNFLTFQ